MHDRENVISEIEDALSDNVAKAGFIYGLSLNGLKDKALTDALALLKEQEAVNKIERLQKHIPQKAELEGGGHTWFYVCPECHGEIDEEDHFCKHCGQTLKAN